MREPLLERLEPGRGWGELVTRGLGTVGRQREPAHRLRRVGRLGIRLAEHRDERRRVAKPSLEAPAPLPVDHSLARGAERLLGLLPRALVAGERGLERRGYR